MKRRVPRLLIGSSRRAIQIAEEIKRYLGQNDALDISIWDEGMIFPLGHVTIQALEETLDKYDFAVLVLTPDHEIREIGSEEISGVLPSGNVIFELGLFMGALKRERTFAVCDSRVQESLFSDLRGVTVGIFEKGNQTSGIRAACSQIRQKIDSFGLNKIIERPCTGFCNPSLRTFPCRSGARLSKGNQGGYYFISQTRQRTPGGGSYFLLHGARLRHQSAVDAVIVIPGAKGWWTDTEVNASVKEILNANKHIVAIENGPSGIANFNAGIAVISSNSRKGAKELAEYAMTLPYTGSRSVLLLFPGFSDNAMMRKEVFEAALKGTGGSVESIITNTWNEQNAYEVILKEMNKGARFDLIICGNDDMALGAVRALYDARLANNTKVLGYDGILRAVAAVAEPSNPLVATMRIPPSTYGKRAARYVRDVFQGIGKITASGVAISIPFDMNVVTGETARDMLENAVWDV